MSFLAVDYGLAKVGLALSEGELAEPLTILKVKNKQDAKQKLISLISLHHVETVVFGIPDPDSIGAASFANSLERSIKIPIYKLDETLTSKIASKKSSKKEDSIAASILLQEYLDHRKGEKVAV